MLHGAHVFFNDIDSLKHPYIRFTVEKEVVHKLPFLDVLINNTFHPSFGVSECTIKTNEYLEWFSQRGKEHSTCYLPT